MLKERILLLLHKWLSENKIAHIRKGMVEDMEQFVNKELSDLEIKRAADRMEQRASVIEVEESVDEENS